MEMDSKYHVGDKVCVRSVEDCRWGVNGQMRKLVGSIVTIKRVVWLDYANVYEYKIEEDDGWSYDDSCFEHIFVKELPNFEASSIDIASLFT